MADSVNLSQAMLTQISQQITSVTNQSLAATIPTALRETREAVVRAVGEIPSEVLFPSGRHGLLIPRTTRSCVRTTLRVMAASIPEMRDEASRQYGSSFHMVVEVAGHTDDDPFLDSDPDLGVVDGSWLLSAQRATTLVHLIEQVLRDDASLREKVGVPPAGAKVGPGQTIIRAVGYASQVPHAVATARAAPESPEAREERQRHDRRVELLLHAEPTYALTSRRSQ